MRLGDCSLINLKLILIIYLSKSPTGFSKEWGTDFFIKKIGEGGHTFGNMKVEAKSIVEGIVEGVKRGITIYVFF